MHAEAWEEEGEWELVDRLVVDRFVVDRQGEEVLVYPCLGVLLVAPRLADAERDFNF